MLEKRANQTNLMIKSDITAVTLKKGQLFKKKVKYGINLNFKYGNQYKTLSDDPVIIYRDNS